MDTAPVVGRYAPWKSLRPFTKDGLRAALGREPTPQDEMLASLCHPAQLLDFLRSFAEFAGKLGVPAPPYKVMELGNRWGSCSPSGVLRFHWLLATQRPGFIRHVVAHELCHLIEPWHGKHFYRLLNRLDPDCSRA